MSNYDARPRQRSAAAVSSTGVAAIVATVLALAIGFVVLRRINNEAGSVTSLGNGSAAEVGSGGALIETPTGTTPGGDVTATTLAPGPTTPPVPTTFAGATVIVANANATGGSAGKASTLLQSVTDFTMGAATDATGEDLPVSVVYYDPNQVLNAEPVARNLARMLGGIAVTPLPSPDVVASLSGAGVVLMLGSDLANLTQNDLVPPLTAAEAAAAAVPPTEPLAETATTVAQ